MLDGTGQRAWHGRGVTLVGGLQLGGNHRAGIEIHRMLRLVRQMRVAIFQLGDRGLWLSRALPVRVGQLLAFAIAVQPDQVLGGWRLDAALFGHARQHLAIAFAVIAPHDRAQRRVGFHRRGIHADPLALDQALLGQTLKHPGEHLVVHFKRQAASGAAQPRVIRHSLALAEPQEFAQRQAVGAPPFQTTLAVDAFEIADQQHAEVATRRQRWAAVPRRILRRTLHLHEPVEVGRDQHGLQLVVESVTRRAWQLRPRYQYVRLPFALPSKSHSPSAFLVRSTANQTQADFVNGLLWQVIDSIGWGPAQAEKSLARAVPLRLESLRAL